MNNELVSVVMPTYNDAPYLEEAINDVLKQTYKNFELIIVNDGSTDNTSEILKKYSELDERIKIFDKKNGGTGSALNLGFSKATGKYGTWVSSDDNKEEVFLERLVAFLESNPDVEFVSSAFYSKYLNSIFKPYHYEEHSKSFVFCNGINHDGTVSGNSTIRDDWCKVNSVQCFLGVCYMFTMDLKRRCGDYITIPGEDYHMAMRMGLNGKYGYIDEVLGTHNNPPDSLSMENRNCVAEADRLTIQLYKKSPKWHLEKIPKIAHFYWGSKKMSFMRFMTIFSFKKQNPDWSIRLYVPSKLSASKNWNTHHKQDNNDYELEEDYFDELKNSLNLKIINVDFEKTPLGNNASEVHKSDYFRWNILHQVGGLWCDMDIMFFKSMKDMKLNNPDNSNCDTFVCFDDRHKINSIGFLMSEKRNFVFKRYSMMAKKNFSNEGYEHIGSKMLNVQYKSFEHLQETFLSNNIYNIEHEEVYYYDFKNLNNVFYKDVMSVLDNNSIGVHWYGGAEESQELNNKLTKENYKDFDNTISKIIERNLEK
jgi:glycosyltransferase involved in cell wall biosynthesis